MAECNELTSKIAKTMMMMSMNTVMQMMSKNLYW